MKHITLLLLFCSIVAHAGAQYINPAHFENSPPVNSASSEWNKKVAENNIRFRTTYFEKFKNGESKGPRKVSYISTYDAKGQFIVGESFKNGKSQYQTFYEYNEEGYETRFVSLKKGKPRMATEFTYNEQNQVVKRSHYWKDTIDVGWYMEYVYADNGNLLEMISFSKDKPQIRWVYEYYPNNSKKSVAKYNRKGKLENITSYECKPEGQLLAMASKDTGRICIRHEFDELGEEIKVVEERSPHGKEGKIIYKYNSKNNLLERAGYNKKGKRVAFHKGSFDERGYLQEHINYKKGGSEIQNRYVYSYDNAGFNTKTERYGPDNELEYIYTYTTEKY